MFIFTPRSTCIILALSLKPYTPPCASSTPPAGIPYHNTQSSRASDISSSSPSRRTRRSASSPTPENADRTWDMKMAFMSCSICAIPNQFIMPSTSSRYMHPSKVRFDMHLAPTANEPSWRTCIRIRHPNPKSPHTQTPAAYPSAQFLSGIPDPLIAIWRPATSTRCWLRTLCYQGSQGEPIGSLRFDLR